MSTMRDELHTDMSTMRDELHTDMSTMRDELHTDMSTMRDELRIEIRDSLSESKRHARVLNEDVRDDIRMLAENFAAMSVKLNSLRR
jgi:hypothetical protein